MAEQARTQGLLMGTQMRINTQNSQNEPGFPRALGSQDDYNREEEKLPLSMRRKLL